MTSTPAWISLGSNLGNRRAILDDAVVTLGQTPGITVSVVSSYRETRPVGGPPGQGPFLNAAARLDTTLNPHELLRALQAIEADLGRVRTVRWGERTLDLDILIFEGVAADEPDLRLPHPRLAVRRFVLEPLAEIAPDAIDARTGRTVVDLLANLDRLPRYLSVDESIQLKVPRFRMQLEQRLPGLQIPRLRLAHGHSWFIDWTNWARARIDDRARLIERCLAEGENRWLIDSINLDLGRFFPGSSASADPTARDADREKDHPVERLAHLPKPTLIVAFRPLRWRARCNHLPTMPSPIYWPEATDPEAIVAEVLAVCRGIEAV